MITIDDFKKLDIRIGKIVKAERVEGVDKLLRLEVDIGSEMRQIVAGIAQWYDPDILVDKIVPILANLEPRTLKGVISQGMMLAADYDGKPILLSPSETISPGSIVK